MPRIEWVSMQEAPSKASQCQPRLTLPENARLRNAIQRERSSSGRYGFSLPTRSFKCLVAVSKVTHRSSQCALFSLNIVEILLDFVRKSLRLTIYHAVVPKNNLLIRGIRGRLCVRSNPTLKPNPCQRYCYATSPSFRIFDASSGFADRR